MPQLDADETSIELEADRLTPGGDAALFIREFGRDVRFCRERGGWLVWDGVRWSASKDRAVEIANKVNVLRLQEAARPGVGDERRSALARHASRSHRRKYVEELLWTAETKPEIVIAADALDANPMLLAVPNGTLDLRTGALREPCRDDFLTKLCGTRYEPNAPCPRWKEFLNRIFRGDRDLIDYVARIVGYSLSGSVQEHLLPVLHGSGANGKSTLIGAVLATLGTDIAGPAPPDFLMLDRKDSHPTALADLVGKRLVAAVETEAGKRLAESLVKLLTGGDRLSARKMHRDHFQFTPTAKLWLAVNHLPRIEGTDHAVWRRIALVPFAVTIPDDEIDQRLPEKLLQEREGILAWAVRGCLAWQREGLASPTSAKAETRTYRESQDVLGPFLRDRCDVSDPNARELTATLAEAYATWASESTDLPLSSRAFAQAMTERGFGRVKNVAWFYRGVRLK